MKASQLPTLARLLTVALIMVSWILATNHCALGLMNPTVQAEAEPSHCHSGKQAPAKDAPAENGVLQCCKAIHGTPAAEKVEVKFDASDFQVQLYVLLQVLAPVGADLDQSPFAFDHGPPRVVSFAESVLQRSLLSHAPPLAV